MTSPLLLHVFPSFNVGGAQIRFAKLANYYGPRWRHAVVALDGQTECLEQISGNVDLTIVPAPQVGHGSLPQRLIRIAGILKRLSPDLLITSNWGSIEWALARLWTPSMPHIHLEDGFGPEESSGQIRRRIMTRQVALRWSTVVIPSQTLLQAAVTLWKLNQKRVHYIPNGLDLQRFNPHGNRETLWPNSTIPHIGTVAALRAEKNIARLLRAAGLLRQRGHDFRLTILGDGPERHRLEQLSRELGLASHIRFAGHTADPASYYRGLDIFALSSDTEQMPFSILEAMASSLPIASTDAGDIQVMVSARNKAQIVHRDEAALSHALEMLISDPVLRLQAGLANRDKAVAEYDQGRMLTRHAELIEQVRSSPSCSFLAGWRKGAA